MNDNTITTDELNNAITAAGYADMIAARDADSITVSVLDTEADAALAAIRRHLPDEAIADYTGNGNTDADGDTTEDIRVSLAR